MPVVMSASFTTQTLQQVTQGQPQNWQVAADLPVSLSTDTRAIGPGDWFVPLKGERFDGHDHLEQAFAQGATGAFISRKFWQSAPDAIKRLPNLLVVRVPIVAYLQLARYHRQRINPKVVAITGSSGKTTTKEMAVQALVKIPTPHTPTVQKSEKNFNNEVGLCQTLLALNAGTDVLVVEMGMRGLGQIALLSEYAQPDVGIITNIGTAHIGLLGSREAIAQAKSEMVEGMDPATSTLVYDGDEPLLQAHLPTVWQGTSQPFSFTDPAVTQLQVDAQGCWSFAYQGVDFQMPAPGKHHVANALAILKAGEALGFNPSQLQPGLTQSIQALERFVRFDIPGAENAWVIDDTYNANPDSMKASLDAFLTSLAPPQQAILILGEMKELGKHSAALHGQVGTWLAAQPGWHVCVVVGADAQPMAQALQAANTTERLVLSASNVDEVLPQLQANLTSWHNTALLLKASRALGLEAVRQTLCTPATDITPRQPEVTVS
jgi:UDP-N-acetylmuramoyl-tripeptide--D-alanyl-D-alanine ligase